MGELHVGLKGTMNALFLKDLAQKTRRGLEGRVPELGLSRGNRPSSPGWTLPAPWAATLKVAAAWAVRLNNAATASSFCHGYDPPRDARTRGSRAYRFLLEVAQEGSPAQNIGAPTPRTSAEGGDAGLDKNGAREPMLILAMIVLGLAAGWVAQLVLGSGRQIDWQLALVTGLIGSFVGGLLASLVAGDGLRIRPSGVIGSILGAIVVLAIVRGVRGGRAPTR